ncbi:hypothetical protein B484DRAFT_408303 [Ochromonadaceae sp. CCMP2298]|nr:hypothetical protein B484DRAFT_408303 [Ochromonadaceae sp. CCMP2298]
MARILLLAALFTVAAALRPLGPLTRMPGGVSPLRASDPSVLDKPAWAAGGFVSDVVNALIGFKPLFNVMKIGARSTLISTAESNDIPWRQLSADMATKQPLLDVLYRYT